MDKEISNALMDKAAVLVEALPYIQKFQNKVMVVKYGGSAMVDEKLKLQVMQDVALLKLVGFRPIIVHGGGKEISAMLSRLGIESKFVNGLRVTDDDTMEVVEMVLNRINKGLVQSINSLGVKSIGISGKDGMLFPCVKKYAGDKDIGFVGDVQKPNVGLLEDLLKDGYVPVICSVGFDNHRRSFNINADDAACAVAGEMRAEKLAFLTDVEGLYRDYNDKNSLIHSLSLDEAQEMIDSGKLGGGMLPKLSSCIEAMKHGVNRVHILDGRIPHCLLLEFFTNRGIGTAINKEMDPAY